MTTTPHTRLAPAARVAVAAGIVVVVAAAAPS